MNVSWYDAIAYCNWRSTEEQLTPVYTIDKLQRDPNNISRKDTLRWVVTADLDADGYRLPTEAEWEYAARQGGKKVRFGNGEDVARSDQMNFRATPDAKKEYAQVGVYREQTVPVGSLDHPNELGLHDMSGNVWEWCWDWYGQKYYASSPEVQPSGPTQGAMRIFRGGSLDIGPRQCRAANRFYWTPTLVKPYLGFRLARSVQ